MEYFGHNFRERNLALKLLYELEIKMKRQFYFPSCFINLKPLKVRRNFFL